MPLGGRLTSVAGGFLSVAFILSGIVFLLVKVKVTPLIFLAKIAIFILTYNNY